MITVKEFTNKISNYSLIKEPEYANVIENLKKYNRLDGNSTLKEKYQFLKDIVKSVEIFIKVYPHSKKNYELENLSNQAKKEFLDLYKLHRNTKIKKEAFTVAEGNIFTEELESYFKFWKDLNPEYKFELYYDSQAYAANILLKFFKDFSGEEVIKKLKEKYEDLYAFHESTFSNESIKIIYKMKKEFNKFFEEQILLNENIEFNDIVKEFLVKNYNYKEEIFKEEINKYNDYFKKLGAIDIRTNLMSSFNNEIDYKIYEIELFRRLNIYDAVNILKLNILHKVGGVYIDINYLPSIKKNIFSGIPIPTNIRKFSKDTIQQLKLIAIMKNKNYVKGFDKENVRGINIYNNELSNEVKASMSESLNKFKNPDEIFEKIGDLNTSELAFLTDIKSTYENPLIAAHKDSLATSAIVEQVRIRYSILNELYNMIELKNTTYDGARLSLINEIKTTTNKELKEFLLSIRYYMENGFLDVDYQYHPSQYLNGHKVLRAAIKNILEFEKFNNIAVKEVYNNRLYILFTLPKIEVTYFSDQALKRDSAIYNSGLNHYINTSKKLGITILEHANPVQQQISTASLTKLVNDKERFRYEKDYVNIILKLQDDDVTYNTAKEIFSKYPENSILIETGKNSGIVYYLDMETMQVVSKDTISNISNHLKGFKKMKISLVGHGSVNTVSKRSPSELMEFINTYIKEVYNTFKEIKQLEVSFFSCKNFNLRVGLEDTYPVMFLKIIKDTDNYIRKLVNSSIENISIATSSYSISKKAGRTNINPFHSLALDKEDAVLRGIIPRYLIKYDKDGKIIIRAKKIKESLEIRNLLEDSTNLPSTSEQSIPNSMLDELGVFLDYENIFLESVKDQDIGVFNTEVQDEFININESLFLLEELNEDFNDIIKENNLSEDYFPDLNSLERLEDKFSLSLINKNSGDKTTIITEKESFERYKNISKDIIDVVKNNVLKFSEGNFIYKYENFQDVSLHTSTLNAAFLLQTLLDYTHSKENMSNLNIAMQIQVYTQLSSTSLGVLSDASSIIKIVNNFIQHPVSLLPRIIEKLQFLNFLFDSINLGSSIYELVHAHTEFEKEIYEANVGITSVNFSLSLASTIAYFTGSTLTSEVLGIIAVPIAGISFGLPSLVNNILRIKYSSQEVIKFFENLNQIRTKGYYKLNDEGNVLIPSPLVPLTEINLKLDTVKVGNMYISKMHGGSIVSSENSSYPTYFASPEADNKGEPIEFSNIIFSDMRQNDLSKSILLLPSALNVRYYTNHNFVYGSARWKGAGENTLDKIRLHYGGRTFHWRFYVAGGEKIITALEPEYMNTNIDIICDNKDRTFISALMGNEEVAQKMSYSIKYEDSVNYTYIFQHIPINLKIEPFNKEVKNYSKWFFNIDNLLYDEKIKDDKEAKNNIKTNLNDLIRFEKNNDNSINLRIGKQKVHIKDYTNESFYITFKYYNINIILEESELDKSDYKELDIILKLDLNECKIESVIISFNMQYAILELLELLAFLKNFGLSSEVLENVNININRNLSSIKMLPRIGEVRGSLNLIKDEYIMSIEKYTDEGINYLGVIYDKNFNDKPVIFNFDRKESTLLKKYNEETKSNDYLVKGFSVVNNANLQVSEDEKNEYLLKIIDKDTITLRSIKLTQIVLSEFIFALKGEYTLYGLFNADKSIDHTTEEGKRKIISGVYDYIYNKFIKDVISVSYPLQNLKLNHKITPDLFISGTDLFGRKLNFIFNKDDYYLAYGEWESEVKFTKEKNHFIFNSLGKKELILSRKQNPNKTDYIVLSESDIINLEGFIESVLINCNFDTNRILFRYFTETIKNNIKEEIPKVDILLPTRSNGKPLVLYLPFNKDNLKWDVEGSNLIIYSSQNDKNKIFTILDVFNRNNDKEVIISIGGGEPVFYEDINDVKVYNSKDMDLISFMKEIPQYSGDN